jgi:hypothetical protein
MKVLLNARSLQCGGIVAEHKNNKVAVVDVEHLDRREPLNLNRLCVRSRCAAANAASSRGSRRILGGGMPRLGDWIMEPPKLGVIR